MSWAGVPIRIGTRFMFDGEVHEITAFMPSVTCNEVLLQGPTSVCRMSVVALLNDQRARLIPDAEGPNPDDPTDPASIALLALDEVEMKEVREKANHVREVLTGYRSGSKEIALDGEPRPEFDPGRKLMDRYEAKATELRVSSRTVRRWVDGYNARGEAGLVSRRKLQEPTTDRRWDDAASDIMQEHTNESMPSKTALILQASARLELQYGEGAVKEPSRATANRHLLALDEQCPTFHGTTKRNRDIAARPRRRYGKLRPTRPGST